MDLLMMKNLILNKKTLIMHASKLIAMTLLMMLLYSLKDTTLWLEKEELSCLLVKNKELQLQEL
jgi:hypothetical protein